MIKMSSIVNEIVSKKLENYQINFSLIDFDIDDWEEILFHKLATLGYEVDINPTHLFSKNILKIEIKYLKYKIPKTIPKSHIKLKFDDSSDIYSTQDDVPDQVFDYENSIGYAHDYGGFI
jgi:hypothetical protein